MDKAQAVELMKNWFTQRFDKVVATKWSDELTSWAECIVCDEPGTSGDGEPEEGRIRDTGHDCRDGHYNEPPIPVVVGFLTQIITDFRNVHDPGSLAGAGLLAACGRLVAPVKTCKHTDNPHVYNKILF